MIFFKKLIKKHVYLGMNMTIARLYNTLTYVIKFDYVYIKIIFAYKNLQYNI